MTDELDSIAEGIGTIEEEQTEDDGNRLQKETFEQRETTEYEGGL